LLFSAFVPFGDVTVNGNGTEDESDWKQFEGILRELNSTRMCGQGVPSSLLLPCLDEHITLCPIYIE